MFLSSLVRTHAKLLSSQVEACHTDESLRSLNGPLNIPISLEIAQ